MSKVLVDRELLDKLASKLDGADFASYGWGNLMAAEVREVIAQPAEAEGVEQPAVFWVLFDATTPEPYIKKMMPEGVLAFFDHEEDAIRAKSFHPGTDYKRVPYVRQSDHLAALSAVTAERDGWRERAIQVLDKKKEWADRARKAEAEIENLRAEAERLRAGLTEARYRIEQGRIWNGMGWTREFNDSQWWFKELEQAVSNGTPSQRRALEVVRNLLVNFNQNL